MHTPGVRIPVGSVQLTWLEAPAFLTPNWSNPARDGRRRALRRAEMPGPTISPRQAERPGRPGC